MEQSNLSPNQRGYLSVPYQKSILEPETLLAIQKDFAVLRADINQMHDRITFYGYSQQFDSIPDYERAPFYDYEFHNGFPAYRRKG